MKKLCGLAKGDQTGMLEFWGEANASQPVEIKWPL